MLLGDASFPEWASVLGIPVWMGGAAFVIWLLLKRVLITSAEADARVAAAELRADDRVTAATAHCDLERAGWGRERSELTARIDTLIADRDAWHLAHGEETMARLAAERAAAALMESTNLSLALLAALKDALSSTERGGHTAK